MFLLFELYMVTPLRKIRLKKNLSLASVAASVDSDAGNISRIENAKQKPSPKLAEDLVKFFDFEISELEILYPERFCVDQDFNDEGEELSNDE